jgi:two-component system, OmpR family, sensor histidine kinase QseC
MASPRALIRRVLATVFVAILVVFALVLALLLTESLRGESGELDRALLLSAKSLARTLDHVDAEGDPRVARALFDEIEVQRREQMADEEPPVHVVVTRHGDSLRMVSAGAPELDTREVAPGVQQVGQAGRDLRLYTAVSGPWSVTLLDDVALRRAAVLRVLLRDLALYLSLALPIILLPVWLAVRGALKPLQRLSDDVAARAPGDVSPIVLHHTYRELLPLQAALNRLFERVAASFERERAFVHDAAHELRTPLAVISTQAHVLQQSDVEARTEAARRLQAAVDRASHLAHQLLRLAQADALRLAPRHSVDVMDLARDILAGFADQA